jgi:hypothetical protein
VIEEQCDVLEAQACSLLRQCRAAERKRDEEIHEYSIAWHKNMANELIKSLPRELRDIIYDNLIFPCTAIILQKEGGSINNACSFPVSSFFLNPEYMPHVANEIAERIYETCTFEVKSASQTASFWRKDLFGMGLKPSEFVRDLRIHLSYENQEIDKFTQLPTIKSEYSVILAQILKVKQPRNFKLTLILVGARLRYIKPLMLALGPFVYQYKEIGIVVKVFRAVQRNQNLLEENGPMAADCNWELTAIFALPAAECKAKVEACEHFVRHMRSGFSLVKSLMQRIGTYWSKGMMAEG